MEISIVGAGYVGLATGIGFASKGYQVTCIDTNKNVVDLINQGIPPFYEDGLRETLPLYVKQRASLKTTTDYSEILKTAVTFVCTGTYSHSCDNTDLGQIERSVEGVGEILRRKEGYHVVAVKSSVVPGTTEGIIIPLLEQYSGKKAGNHFGVVVNPEFLQEGRALHCFLNPDRIIIGEYDQRSGDVVEEICRSLSASILRTEIRSAEMIKFASNAFLATKISFINEVGNLCKKLGIDVYEVAKGMGYDPRIGSLFLNAGIGFGGSCLPKDLETLCSKFEEVGEKPDLLEAVAQVNNGQPQKMIEIAVKRLGDLRDKRIAVLGLAFKSGTDDIRHAPAIKLVHQLVERGAKVKVYDPKAMSKAKQSLPEGVKYGRSAKDTVNGSNCILILTEWDEFRDENIYSGKLVIDGRRALDPGRARQLCEYEGICW